MIPFLEHDYSYRTLMGSNMQKQAVPVIRPEAPLVATGIEEESAPYSGRIVIAEEAGEVVAGGPVADQAAHLEVAVVAGPEVARRYADL